MTNSTIPEMDALMHGIFVDAGLAEAAATALYQAPGETTQIECRVYVDRNLQTIGDFGPSSGPRTLIGILLADVPAPAQGALITIGSEVFSLESQESRDEGISRWVVGNGDL